MRKRKAHKQHAERLGDIPVHERTRRLLDLMAAHHLNAADVAGILNCTAQTVRIWRCKNGWRVIPASLLRLLELELAARGPAKVTA